MPASQNTLFKNATTVSPKDFDNGLYTSEQSLSDQYDTDIFRFHLQEGQKVTIWTDTANDLTPDTYLLLAAPGPQEVQVFKENDDSGGTTESYLEYTALQSGIYYAVVEWSQSEQFEFIGGPYGLNIWIA